MSSPPIASPCINVCRMDEKAGFCVGCFRTLEEIAFWGRASDALRARILQAVEHHRGRLRIQPLLDRQRQHEAHARR